tara:strand:- start:458 stop:1054 length:597 start_codon:yes stop_codon:yes gene_type:complete
MTINKWQKRQDKDIYVKKAKEKGYVSRAAFKLIEIEKKYKLIIKSKCILDLGSSPGSWLQVIKEINKKVKIDSFDILPLKINNLNINFNQIDFQDYDFDLITGKYDLILSDISPNSSGNKKMDHLRIATIIEKIILLIKKIMLKEGNFVFKIFSGSELLNIEKSLKFIFEKVVFFKPKSSRKESSEIYIIALNYKIKN